MRHLSFEDMERYLMEDDFSEEYLCWLEPVAEHLAVCKTCVEEVNRLMLLSELFDEQPAFSFVNREQELRRKYIAAKLELLAMSRVAERIRQGEVIQFFLQMKQLKRKVSVMRGAGVEEGCTEGQKENIVMYYTNGKLVVEVPCVKEAGVTVILAFSKKDREPVIVKAQWSTEKNVAIAEFVITESVEMKADELYEIYVDIE